jgi:hypothetical protein
MSTVETVLLVVMVGQSVAIMGLTVMVCLMQNKLNSVISHTGDHCQQLDMLVQANNHHAMTLHNLFERINGHDDDDTEKWKRG